MGFNSGFKGLKHFYSIPDLSPHRHQLHVTSKLQTYSWHLKFAVNQKHKQLDHKGKNNFTCPLKKYLISNACTSVRLPFFDIHVTIHRVKFLIIKPTRCTNFSNLFLEWNSTCFRQFLCPSSGVFHCTHGNGICHTGLLTAC